VGGSKFLRNRTTNTSGASEIDYEEPAKERKSNEGK
jgi:hypothetical protein